MNINKFLSWMGLFLLLSFLVQAFFTLENAFSAPLAAEKPSVETRFRDSAAVSVQPLDTKAGCTGVCNEPVFYRLYHWPERQ